ncbi:holo-ACP synthase [Campylobacter cuniculorum]|uniref:Holo-[acyl-carrier-protein] synthase n=2 Tax=Campylobacter cuniculorum TaxID=374106 RepID=A0A1W6BVT4_9BACT|nr:holo-ACP synthase [Campylobacter cuniculorum]ARJ56191.1 holo-(acyl-carrier-protein) synthase [Campylobacter cuniculorum DSM 23162 = LMG 24588]QOR03682.1 holo-ACP synthase [Campylobacter cuniculorum]
MKIGCDLVSIARIEKIYQKHGEKFLDKFLDTDEQKLFKTSSSLAGLWAAKEAASKALGVGISLECSFFDIKISKDSKNAPKLDFSQKILKNFKVQTASLSISHDFGFAMAVVIVG